MTHIDWSKAPAGATHARIDDYRFPWRMLKNGIWHAWHGNWMTVTSSDHSLYVERPSPAWNGEGNPPPGVLIEMLHAGCRNWQEITPLHSGSKYLLFERYAGEEVIEEALPFAAIKLRPIRTAEQMAADERLHQIRNACSAISQATESYNLDVNCSAAMRAVVEAMIDEGYRKQVAP